MAGTKGFRVDPDKLLAVADQARRLHDDLTGASGYVSGCLSEYQKANSDILRTSLSDFIVAGGNAYADAYDHEHTGIVDTMTAMATQLANLEAACRATAKQYAKQDSDSKHRVKSTTPTNWAAKP